MKTRDIKELHAKSESELMIMLRDKKARLHTLTLDLAAGKVKNAGEIREVRKDIARILTCLQEGIQKDRKK